MKEPWKKTCEGKVVITLDDEKTTPTAVEMPVGLNWTTPYERKKSSSKTIVLVGVLVILGLTLITLFKVQNLVYSTNYMSWRMQSLESAVGENNNDIKLIKYKMSLDDEDWDMTPPKAPEAQALVAPKSHEQEINHDLKLSESQNHKNIEADKENEIRGKTHETQPAKKSVETKNAKEVMDLNDARNHRNPSDDTDEQMVETVDVSGDDVIPHHLINILRRIVAPDNNVQIIKVQETSQENERVGNQKIAPGEADRNTMDILSIDQHQQQQQQLQESKNFADEIREPLAHFVNNFFQLVDPLGMMDQKAPAYDEQGQTGVAAGPNFLIHKISVKYLPVAVEPVDNSNILKPRDQAVNYHYPMKQEDSKVQMLMDPNMKAYYPDDVDSRYLMNPQDSYAKEEDKSVPDMAQVGVRIGTVVQQTNEEPQSRATKLSPIAPQDMSPPPL